MIRFETGVNRWSAPCLVRLTGGRGLLRVEVLKGRVQPERLQCYVADWFDLERDLRPLARVAGRNEAVAALWKRYRGMRVVWVPAPFETLCWSVIGQQINLAFAYQLKRRLVEAYGTSFDFRGHAYWNFPTPLELARATKARLLAMKFSRQKADYLMGLARLFADAGNDVHSIRDLETEAARELLTGIHGIGRWSANYTLMRAFKRIDAWPYGDAGLARAYLDEVAVTPDVKKVDWDAVEVFMGRFEGWQAYITQLLWNAHGDARASSSKRRQAATSTGT
jgi:DNA-3-methyladenine glycosylase II